MIEKVLVVLVGLLVSLGAEELPLSAELRKEFDLAEFYQQAIVVEGFPIVASEKVAPVAMREAEWVIRGMLGERKDILRALAKSKTRYSVMAVEERTSDVPEHSDLGPSIWWDRRARGLGATPQRPSVSCGEENLLCCAGDPYSSENITVHEFAHAVHEMGLAIVDPTFDKRLGKTFRRAMAEGKWKGKYAATNRQEYWAEAVQSWFETNREDDHDHNHVNTRKELVEYDPAVAKLCEEVFGKENPWVYVRSDDPSRIGKGHLKGLDREKLPVFAWTEEEKKEAGKKREGK